MSWVEQEPKNRVKIAVTSERTALLDKVKAEALPKVQHEASTGDKFVKPVQFQPVHSPGIFEAEFALRDGDVIFHFWPWGLHEAERNGQPRPAFKDGFSAALRNVLATHFPLFELTEDRDMGAWFVKIPALGKKQFWHKLSVSMVTDLHFQLGGEK